ncbi:hypothetical protein AUP68_10391 [Ilyonectria robusta]
MPRPRKDLERVKDWTLEQRREGLSIDTICAHLRDDGHVLDVRTPKRRLFNRGGYKVLGFCAECTSHPHHPVMGFIGRLLLTALQIGPSVLKWRSLESMSPTLLNNTAWKDSRDH